MAKNWTENDIQSLKAQITPGQVQLKELEYELKLKEAAQTDLKKAYNINMPDPLDVTELFYREKACAKEIAKEIAKVFAEKRRSKLVDAKVNQ